MTTTFTPAYYPDSWPSVLGALLSGAVLKEELLQVELRVGFHEFGLEGLGSTTLLLATKSMKS